MAYKIELAYNSIADIRNLFVEYSDNLGIDLDFQGFKYELDTLPADYALPRGRLYLAYQDITPIGCIAMRPFNSDLCEMKRLYVRKEHRGEHIGLALTRQIIVDAKLLQYKSILLDTLSSLEASIALYKKLGFYEIDAYRNNPYANAMFFKLDLS